MVDDQVHLYVREKGGRLVVGRSISTLLLAHLNGGFVFPSIGLDGAVLIEVMQDGGVKTEKLEGSVQRLRRGEGAKGADPVYPRLLDFWQVLLCLGDKKLWKSIEHIV